MSRTSFHWHCILALVVVGLLSGCNGKSGGNSDPDSDQPPVINNDPDGIRVIQIETDLNGSTPEREIKIAIGESRVIPFQAAPSFRLADVSGCHGVLEEGGYRVDGSGPHCTVYASFEPSEDELTIDVFGEGVVLDPALVICSGRETCLLQHPRQSSISLLAEPAAGWKFSHWRGCDNLVGASCELTMDGNRVVQPIFANDVPLDLQDDVRILSAAQLDSVQQVEEGMLIFAPTVPDVDSWVIGEVLVSTRDEGFARRIINLSRSSGSPVSVQTRDVGVSDVIKNGTVIWDAALDSGSGSIFIPDEGVEVISSGNRSLSTSIGVRFTYDQDGRDDTRTDQIQVTAQIGLNLNPLLAIDFSLRGVDEILVGLGAQISPSFSFEYRYPLRNFSREKRLGEVVLAPVVAGPLVLIPRYSMFVKLSSGNTATVRVESSFSIGGTASIHYRRGEGTKLPRDFDVDGSLAQVEIESDYFADLFVGLDMDMLIYGAGGPFVRLGPTARLRFSTPIGGERLGCVDTLVQVGGRGELGGRIDFLSVKFSQTPYRFEVKAKVIEQSSEQGVDCTVPPAPTNVVAKLLEDNTIQVSWEESSDGNIFKYIVYRDDQYLADTFGGEAFDTETMPETTYCYTIAAINSQGQPSERSVLSDEACVTTEFLDVTPPPTPLSPQIDDVQTNSAKVSWQPVVDDSGDVVEYIVFVDGNRVERTTLLSYGLVQLAPATEYCISLIAVDPTGNESESSLEKCFSTLPSESDIEPSLQVDSISCQVEPYPARPEVSFLRYTVNGRVSNNREINGLAGILMFTPRNPLFPTDTGFSVLSTCDAWSAHRDSYFSIGDTTYRQCMQGVMDPHESGFTYYLATSGSDFAFLRLTGSANAIQILVELPPCGG